MAETALTPTSGAALHALPTPQAMPTMSVEQAAAFVGVHYQTLLASIRRGEFPAMQVGRQYRVSTAELRRWLGIDA